MSSKNWKILLGYKSERNVTKHSRNRACVLLLWEEKLLHVTLWQSTSAATSKLYSYNTSMGNPQIQCFGRMPVDGFFPDFFPDFLRAQNMVRDIEGKIILKWSEGKQKLLRVSGSFELSRVRVTEGKITVNVWRKSRGNRFWFELVRGSS